MGGNGSTTRKVSFGLDENEKVTVIEGVKLSEDVLRRMRDSQGSDSSKPPPSKSQSKTFSLVPELPLGGPLGQQNMSPYSDEENHNGVNEATGPSTTEVQEEIRKNFERQQAAVQEQLARLAQKERETGASASLDELTPALLIESGKTHEEQEKAKILTKQLRSKEKELAAISSFYKKQLEILEKKNLDNYQQTAERYNEAATQAEAYIRPRRTASVCSELQATVLQCYRENPQQTLLCSGLARQYMTCVHQAKQSTLTNHG